MFYNGKHLKFRRIIIRDHYINLTPEHRSCVEYIFITSKLFNFNFNRFCNYFKDIINTKTFSSILNDLRMFETENQNDLIIFDERKKKLYFVQNYF